MTFREQCLLLIGRMKSLKMLLKQLVWQHCLLLINYKQIPTSDQKSFCSTFLYIMGSSWKEILEAKEGYIEACLVVRSITQLDYVKLIISMEPGL